MSVVMPKDKIIFVWKTSRKVNFLHFLKLIAVRNCEERDLFYLCHTNLKTMKILSKSFFIVMIGLLISCSKPEKSMYDQVMDIHDEVMPKMGDLHKAKKQLQDSLANTTTLTDEQKKEMEGTILMLDSASDSMMDWMHDFNPPEASNKEAFNKYMESELVKVKKMKEDVMRALKKIDKQ